MRSLQLTLFAVAALLLALWLAGVATVYRIGPAYMWFLVAAVMCASLALGLGRPRVRQPRGPTPSG